MRKLSRRHNENLEKTKNNIWITISICPNVFKILKRLTPTVEPSTPPIKRNKPILKSTFLLLQWAITPDTEEAKICGASVPTATIGGIPRNISKGVIKNPPPTPNKPERPPTTIPIKIISKILTFISAIGKYIDTIITILL